jgi:hypothetical protein
VGALLEAGEGKEEEEAAPLPEGKEADDDEESECEEEPEVIELSHDPSGGVKVINFAEMLKSTEEPEENDNNSEELGELDELDDIEDLDDESEGSGGSPENINSSNLEFIKSIDISNLEESGEKNTVDYKKMSLNKLKEIAVSKGLINENSKATKNAILKLLGSE